MTLTSIRSARAEVRERDVELADASSPETGGQLIVDLDGVLVLAHSDKQGRDLEEVLRTPSADGVRRPRTRRHRGAGGRAATAPGKSAATPMPTTSPPPNSPWPSSRNVTGAAGPR